MKAIQPHRLWSPRYAVPHERGFFMPRPSEGRTIGMTPWGNPARYLRLWLPLEKGS